MATTGSHFFLCGDGCIDVLVRIVSGSLVRWILRVGSDMVMYLMFGNGKG